MGHRSFAAFYFATLGTMFSPMTTCMCGYMDMISMTVTLPTVCLAWWGFSRVDKIGLGRIFVWFLVIASSMLFLKNVADILWLGHDPLLGQ